MNCNISSSFCVYIYVAIKLENYIFVNKIAFDLLRKKPI